MNATAINEKIAIAVQNSRPEVDEIWAVVPSWYPEGTQTMGGKKVITTHNSRPVPDADWSGIVSEPMPKDRLQWLSTVIQELCPFPGDHLDVGCGVGTLGAHMVDLGWRSFGVDINQDAVDTAISVGVEAVRCPIQCTGEYLNRRYDLITAIASLEHVPSEYHEELSEIRRACKVLVVVSDNTTVSSLHTQPDIRKIFGQPILCERAHHWPKNYRLWAWA